jgi:LysM repeat protein
MHRSAAKQLRLHPQSESITANFIMNPIRILAPTLLTAALVSCASQSADQYDTANPYGAANAALTPAAPAAPSNPVYDTPPAYEESGVASAAAAVPGAPAEPTAASVPAAPVAVSPHAPAIIHTVVKGDTLSGISAKYKIPSASIRQANRMTNDTVVLGRKMVIPPQ